VRALSQGDLDAAARLLRTAADHRSTKHYVLFAQFHLAQLYGTPGTRHSNRASAYELFSRIAINHAGIDPQLDWRNTFVGRAEFEMARYLKAGIAELDLAPDAAAARDHLVRAAQIFGDPDAQLELAKLDLENDDTRRAGLDLLSTVAEQRGHSEALAYLSELYVTGEYVGRVEPELSYAYAMLAVENARNHERPYIESIYQRVFCRTSLADRERGMAMLAELRALNEETRSGKPARNAELESITSGVTWRCGDGAVVASPVAPLLLPAPKAFVADGSGVAKRDYRPAAGGGAADQGITLEFHVPDEEIDQPQQQ
jgi:hypothetical protein